MRQGISEIISAKKKKDSPIDETKTLKTNKSKEELKNIGPYKLVKRRVVLRSKSACTFTHPKSQQLTVCFSSDIFLSVAIEERKMKKNFAGRVPIVAALSFLLIAAGIFIVSACEGISGKTINIMSFNIRYDNPEDGDNSWKNRKEMVAETKEAD